MPIPNPPSAAGTRHILFQNEIHYHLARVFIDDLLRKYFLRVKSQSNFRQRYLREGHLDDRRPQTHERNLPLYDQNPPRIR